VKALITGSIRDSKTYGLSNQSDIAQFAKVTAMSGFASDTLPVSARAILMSHGLDPQQKLQRYADWVQATTGSSAPPAMSFAAIPPGQTIQPCPLQRKKMVDWIEIELIGEDGKAIPYEEYEVTLPDGQLVRGYLDAQGFARFDQLDPPGTCEVRFPRLDKEAWEKAGTLPEKGWS
jgi:hypothetical protein